ncbi:MAG TPA: hypothetical protein VN887_14740 [Candidatus Angelobacter sp.]|nr:hypothetical protein [Candidatus Angelobacter sp.]
MKASFRGFLLVGFVAALTSCVSTNVTPGPTVRIAYNHQRPADYQLIFFVNTHSLKPPIATLADNDGFPLMATLYAKPWEYQGMQGIMFKVVFTGGAKGTGVAVNLWQPNMKGPFTISPLN